MDEAPTLEEPEPMKKSKFTTEQIAFALRPADAGLAVEDVCRKLGVSQATSAGSRRMATSAPPSCAGCGSSRRRTPSSSGWWPT
jgi:putative transposase